MNYDDYFNSDVILMNPNFIKNNFDKLLEGTAFIKNNNYIYWEQDVLNYLFSTNYLHLPRKFNTFVNGFRLFNLGAPRIEKVIYHFAGSNPSLNTNDIFDRLYLEYFLKTPWANVEMFGNIHKVVAKKFDDLKDMLLHFTNLLAYKQRAFITDGNSIEAVRNIFAVRDDELITDISQFATPEDFSNHMSQYQGGNKIFFILSANYNLIKNLMFNNKFVENVDFVNGFMFLSERFGFKDEYYSREIAKEM